MKHMTREEFDIYRSTRPYWVGWFYRKGVERLQHPNSHLEREWLSDHATRVGIKPGSISDWMIDNDVGFTALGRGGYTRLTDNQAFAFKLRFG